MSPVSACGHTCIHLKSFNWILQLYLSHVRRDSRKTSVSLDSLTKPFSVDAKPSELKLQMLIASMRSDSG